jgi:hypothetical protein
VTENQSTAEALRKQRNYFYEEWCSIEAYHTSMATQPTEDTEDTERHTRLKAGNLEVRSEW